MLYHLSCLVSRYKTRGRLLYPTSLLTHVDIAPLVSYLLYSLLNTFYLFYTEIGWWLFTLHNYDLTTHKSLSPVFIVFVIFISSYRTRVSIPVFARVPVRGMIAVFVLLIVSLLIIFILGTLLMTGAILWWRRIWKTPAAWSVLTFTRLVTLFVPVLVRRVLVFFGFAWRTLTVTMFVLLWCRTIALTRARSGGAVVDRMILL